MFNKLTSIRFARVSAVFMPKISILPLLRGYSSLGENQRYKTIFLREFFTMKLSNFIMALITAVGLSGTANAAMLPSVYETGVYIAPSTYSTLTTLVNAPNSTYGSNTLLFLQEGMLEANTKVTFTYTATNIKLGDGSFWFEANQGALGSAVPVSLDYSSFDYSSFFMHPSITEKTTDPSLPVVLTASMTPGSVASGASGTLSGTITISNAGATNQYFRAFINSQVVASFLESVTTVTAITSAVPVPAAALLFGTGLLGLAGVRTSRKSKAQA